MNKEWHVSGFELFEKSLNGESLSPVHALRQSAMAKFNELGFPTQKDEEWRFTNISSIKNLKFKPVLKYDSTLVGKKDVVRHCLTDFDCYLLVFVNGQFSDEYSSIQELPEGVVAGNMADMFAGEHRKVPAGLGTYAETDSNAFTALNTAFMKNGAYICVPDGTIMTKPIYVLYLSTHTEEPFIASPRNLFLVGKRSEVAIIENYAAIGHGTYLTNAVTEILAGENAVIEHDKIQNESDHSFHISSTFILQENRSNYTSNSISFGGLIVRNNITSVLGGEGIECTLNGLSLSTGTQLIDNHTTIDHAKPHCNSHELYKAILEGNSRGVFNGKIFVRQDAQKTDAKQTNKTLLLSDDATMDTKPQLEIFADDVKCTHGATVGQLDDEQIFYLRTRGLGLEEARDMLTNAFASDVIQRIKVEGIRDLLQAILHIRLCKGRLKGVK